VLAGVYFLGGYGSFDPDKQGRDGRAKIKPGMTLQQIVGIKELSNPKYRSISLVKQKVGKSFIETEREGPPVDFDKKKVERRIKDDEVPQGFYLDYRFSEQVAFTVRFDSAGKVESVEDLATVADLLQTRKPE
jgi:hypothetical protein